MHKLNEHYETGVQIGHACKSTTVDTTSQLDGQKHTIKEHRFSHRFKGIEQVADMNRWDVSNNA